MDRRDVARRVDERVEGAGDEDPADALPDLAEHVEDDPGTVGARARRGAGEVGGASLSTDALGSTVSVSSGASTAGVT
jgi:hypothetical protein